jgi:CheY-like chemotaxis protein
MYTVVIADPDSFQRQLIDLLLAVDNYQVRDFGTGRGVLEYLQGHSPDLLILDYDLPDLNGADLCARIKKVKRLANVPVVVLCGLHQVAVVREIAAVVRADLVLAKPLGDKALRQQVLRLLQTKPPLVDTPNKATLFTPVVVE